VGEGKVHANAVAGVKREHEMICKENKSVKVKRDERDGQGCKEEKVKDRKRSATNDSGPKTKMRRMSV
jgi:hypothetical protein